MADDAAPTPPLPEPETPKEAEKKPPKRQAAVRVSYPADSSSEREDYQRNIKKQLEEDKIPPIILESGRLVAEGDSADADLVIGYVRKVLDRLSIARTGKPSPNLRIFLSDQQGINTAVITDSKTPILICGLGMIDKILEYGFGEDQVAAIFGHERFHLRRHQKWQDMENGRPEETVADVWGVMESADAGYNPQALGKFFRALGDELRTRRDEASQGLGAVLGELVDEHPNLDNRIRTTEIAIANLQLTKRLPDNQTEIPPEIVAAADRVHFMSPWDIAKQQDGYAAATPAERVDIIAKYFGRELAEKPAAGKWGRDEPEADPWLMSHRLAAAYEDMKALKGAPGVEEAARRQLYAFFSREDEQGDFYNDTSWHYLWVLRQFTELNSPTEPAREDYHYTNMGIFDVKDDRNNRQANVYGSKLPADLRRLATSSEAFWATASKDEAVAAAKAYEQAVTELAPYKRGLEAMEQEGRRTAWPQRHEIRQQIKDRGYARLPWEDQLRWALEGGEDGALIGRVALNLDLPDQRLTGRPRPASEMGASAWSDGFDIPDLTLNEKGNITALALSEKEMKEEGKKRFKAKTGAELFRRELKRQRAREASEEEQVRVTDWSGMEKDFWGFVAGHGQLLSPDFTIVPSKAPFAAAFMDRLEALKKADPAKWEQDYTAFLTGYFPDGRGKDRWGEQKMQPNSLPDLMKNAGEACLGYFDPYSYARNVQFAGTRGKLPDGHPLEAVLASFHDKRRGKSVFYEDEKNGRYISYDRKPRPVPPAHEKIEVQIRAHARHPYVKPLLAMDKKQLWAGRKGALLSHFHFDDPEAATPEAFFTRSPRKIFNYAACRSPAALQALEQKMESKTNDDHGSYARNVAQMEFLKTLRRLDRAKTDERFAISKMSFFAVAGGFTFFHDPRLAAALEKETGELVNRQIERNRRLDFAPEVSLKTLIGRFIEDHAGREDNSGSYGTNIFATRPDLEKDYLVQIRRRVMALPLSARVAPLEQLMTLQIQDPAYRDWAVGRWVDAVAAETGKDKGDPAYAAKLLARMKTSIKHLDAAQGIGCVTALVEKVEAQREVALGARDILTDIYGRQFLEKDGAMRAIESAIGTCASQPELRQALLKYITEPLTKSGTRAFTQALKKSVPKGEKYISSPFIKKFYDPEHGLFMSPLQERLVVDSLHKNLWAMPFEMRTVYLDRILFPVGRDNAAEFDKAVTFVLDKVMPPERKFSAEAREALQVYLDGCPPELRRVTFSAILATTRRAEGKTPLRLGQVLSYVFSRTGAAGGQLLQAAHSYLSGIEITDPDLRQLREDLKSSKVDFQRPYRWDIFERLDEALPEDMRKGFTRIGALLGCGSTAYVVATEKNDGKQVEESALKLMRKDVIPIADLQFERYGQAFAELAKRHEHFAPLPAMVDHARQLIRVAGQGTVAAKQVAYAQKSYDPLVITIDGEKYDFKVAPVLSSGPEYLETKLVGGEHLNDLKTKTPGDRRRRRNLSIASETADICRMLEGRAVDQDRHGYQQKVEANTTGVFDVGALPFDAAADAVAEPTAADKRALGRLLGLAFDAAMAGKSPVETLVHAVTDRDWGDAKPYLVGVKRGLLARMDIHAGFGETAAEKSAVQAAIFRVALKTGRVDRDIFTGLTETIDLNACRRLAGMALSGEKPAVDIAVADSSATGDTPKLTLASALGMIAKTGLKRAFNRVGTPLGASPVKRPEPPQAAPAPATAPASAPPPVAAEPVPLRRAS